MASSSSPLSASAQLRVALWEHPPKVGLILSASASRLELHDADGRRSLYVLERDGAQAYLEDGGSVVLFGKDAATKEVRWLVLVARNLAAFLHGVGVEVNTEPGMLEEARGQPPPKRARGA